MIEIERTNLKNHAPRSTALYRGTAAALSLLALGGCGGAEVRAEVRTPAIPRPAVNVTVGGGGGAVVARPAPQPDAQGLQFIQTAAYLALSAYARLVLNANQTPT